MLFQRIIRETETAKTSSSYGLKPVEKKNGGTVRKVAHDKTGKTRSSGEAGMAKGTSEKEGTRNCLGVGGNGTTSSPSSKKED